MQNENLIKNEQEKNLLKISFPSIDLDTKKEIAKIGMTASMGITVATSFYMKNRLMKNLHIGAGVALVGFSFWHHMLYQPEKKGRKKESKVVLKQPENDEGDIDNYAISFNNFFIELSIKGKLTTKEMVSFKNKIESLLETYEVPSMNILLDISNIDGIELKALWEDLLFSIKHLQEIKKVAIVGNSKLEEYSIKIANKLLKVKLSYFEEYETAHNWLLK